MHYFNALLVLKKKERNINILDITNLNKVIILNITYGHILKRIIYSSKNEDNIFYSISIYELTNE